MSELLLLKGLPGSGKTTYAKALKGYKRVNMDDLRRMLDDGVYSKENEKVISKVRRCMVYDLITRDHNVVVDDTNLNPEHAEEFKDMVSSIGLLIDTRTVEGVKPTYRELLMDTPLETCIARDLKREHFVGKDVIMGMYNQYLKHEEYI